MGEEAPSSRRRLPGAIGAASLMAAALTWLLQIVVGQALGPGGFAHFMVVWGLVFTAVGILQGVQQEVTRSVAGVEAHGMPAGAPVMGSGLVVAVLGVVVIAASASWWEARTGVDRPGEVLAALVVVWATYAVAQTLSGVLAARQQWSTYAWAILLEAVCRFVAVVLGVLATRVPAVIGLGLAGGVIAWLLLAPSPAMRRAPAARAQGSVARQVARTAQTMLAAGCSALLISGFPLLLELTSPGELGAGAGVVLAVLVASRAPLLLFLNAYQGIFITRLMATERPLRPILRASLAGLGVGVLGAAVSFVAGPPVVRLVFGPGFDADPALFPALVAASLALGLLTVTGWAALAHSQHTGFLLGWVAAVVATTLLLLVPAVVDVRASVALVLGPLLGAAVHVLSLRSSRTAASRPIDSLAR